MSITKISAFLMGALIIDLKVIKVKLEIYQNYHKYLETNILVRKINKNNI